jgi:hypothetical protein
VLERFRRAARVMRATYRQVVPTFEYEPADRWRTDFVELKDFMRKAFSFLRFNKIEGDYAEFGVFGGRTFALAYGASRLIEHHVHMWAFDSFEGLPEASDSRDEHPKWVPGTLAMSEAKFRKRLAERGVPEDAYTTVPGMFGDSLRPDAPGPRPEKIAFVYVDCDLYSSTVDVLRFLEPRLHNGMVIAFDDWFCPTPDTPAGERLAAAEFFDASPRWSLLPFVQYGWHGMSFIVERAIGT